MRKSEIQRKTAETDISMSLDIDGRGIYDIKTDCGFFDHMLELFARHGRFDVSLECRGDSHVDYHHTVEDTGIVMGRAFREALGDKKGIRRYGSMIMPMDEVLMLCALDISGRCFLNFDVEFKVMKVTSEETEKRPMMAGLFDTELVSVFLDAFCRELGLTLHVMKLSGENTHHIIEAVFKGLGRAMAAATEIDPKSKNEIPSTKGVL